MKEEEENYPCERDECLTRGNKPVCPCQRWIDPKSIEDKEEKIGEEK